MLRETCLYLSGDITKSVVELLNWCASRLAVLLLILMIVLVLFLATPIC